MRRTSPPAALALIALAPLAACSTERAIEGSYSETELVSDNLLMNGTVGAPIDGNLDVLSSALRGALGPVAVDSEAEAMGFADVGFTTIYSEVDDAAGGAVMTIVDVIGGLGHEALVPGAELQFAADDLAGVDEGEVFVSVIGCSGQSPGAWDFDQGAETVTVVVDEGQTEETVVVTYTAHFTGAQPSIVTGSFEAAR